LKLQVRNFRGDPKVPENHLTQNTRRSSQNTQKGRELCVLCGFLTRFEHDISRGRRLRSPSAGSHPRLAEKTETHARFLSNLASERARRSPMANKTRRNSWEASLLAAALAIAGTLFFFDKLGSLLQNGAFSLQAALHAAPVLVVVLGISLLLADQSGIASRSQRSREGRHE
jgi:hypothetical protein